ncbi:MAG: glycoside hydrolase family 5 protein [Lachnospiraceae bacterium]|nr:glycoside hydrolase family 5 protein [Lachnospiraceae bacterium]
MKKLEGYSHGVNLGGWLSQCVHTKEHYDSFITEHDIETIKNWGLDHIRIPVDYDLVEADDGSYREDGFAYIQKAIDWCGKYGLNMVLDLHKTFGFSFDSGEGESGFFENEAYQNRFYRLWDQFAQRFGKYHDRLCFELLNEVTKKEYCDAWNRIAETCVKRIRAFAPDIQILLGGYYNNSIEALKDLALPFDDKIVYNFHCYEPLIFTHQGAGWVDGMPRLFRMRINSTYKEYADYARKNIASCQDCVSSFDPSARMGIEFFERLMDEAVRVAEERDVALYCGEFGVIELAEAVDTLEWYRLICTCMDRHGIGRAAWSYKKMDFGLADPHMDPVRDEILKLL